MSAALNAQLPEATQRREEAPRRAVRPAVQEDVHLVAGVALRVGQRDILGPLVQGYIVYRARNLVVSCAQRDPEESDF